MKHALCRICGHHHAGIDHIWSDAKPVDLSKLVSAETQKYRPFTAVEMQATITEVTRRLASPSKPAPFDRVAYQREYMRKRRAKMKDNH